MKILRNITLFAFTASGICLSAGSLSAQEAKPAKKPNIVMFFVDDLGWADIGANGSTFYETPHIDLLAKGGVNFTNSYSANPVCSPTRAALMSGKAPQRVGITQWIHQPSEIHLKAEEFTIAEALKKHGYTTGYIGKWHIGEKDNQMPVAQGFDWMRAVNRAGQPASYYFPYNNKRKGAFWNVPDLDGGKKGDYLTDALTDLAIEFIDDNADKPFYLNFAHYAIHTPIQPPKELVEKYKNKRAKLFGKTKTPFSVELYKTSNRDRQDHPGYAAMMENLDANVGKVVDHLDSKGLLENTIIIFTSDNGGLSHLKGPGAPTSNRPLRSGKGWTFEGGIRVPHIVFWKGKIKPAKDATPVITMDHYPTMLELAGLPLEEKQHVDGSSLKSALMGEPSKKLKKRFLAWTYPHNHGSGHRPSHAIRMDGYKLIVTDTTRMLFNLAEDPSEAKPLTGAENDKRADKLEAHLKQWIKETTPE